MKYTKITLPYKIKSGVLALGVQSKSAFCFAKGSTAYLSDSGGDLGELGNFKKFERQIKIFQKKLKIRPDIIACDLHPEYTSTKYALRVTSHESRVTKIQHHEAHIASCIADNKVKGRVIGVAFDGTGFGRDGNIWGGEFFTGGVKGFKRAAHLRYIPMPGGEASIKEPWRMAFSYLYSIYGKAVPSGILSMVDKEKIYLLRQCVDKKINSPLTSSMGRLFDGVSSLIGICDFAGYEGEAAMKLEKIIGVQSLRLKVKNKYAFKYDNKEKVIIIDWAPVIKGIAKDLKNGAGKPEVSLKFHNAICGMIRDVCNIFRTRDKIKNVCLSGGVFQNRYLSSSIRPVLEKDGFDVYMHKMVPMHDGGIALGQVILAYES